MKFFYRISLIFSFTLISVATAFAGGYYNNYQYLIGERAACMGGAYTAIADDASALWYNPAGLANVRSMDFSISGNAYNYLNSKTEGYVEFEIPDSGGEYDEIDLNESDVSAVATTLVFGKKLENAGTFACGIFVPYQDNLSGSMKGETLSASTNTYVEAEFHDQTKYLTGMAGWANNFFNKLNVGASVSLGYYTGKYIETEYFFDQWDLDTADPKYTNETFRETSEFTDYLVSATIGAQLKVTENNTVAVKVAAPGLSMYGKSKARTLELAAGDNGKTDNIPATDEIEKDPFEKILPEVYTVGYSYSNPGVWAFNIEAEYIGTTDEDPNFVINYKAGAEVFFTEKIAMRAGFFTDFSQQDSVDSGSDSVEDIDYYGVSMGFSFANDISTNKSGEKIKQVRTWTTVGLVYRWGNGDVVTDSYDDSLDQSDIIREKKINNLSMFIGESISF